VKSLAAILPQYLGPSAIALAVGAVVYVAAGHAAASRAEETAKRAETEAAALRVEVETVKRDQAVGTALVLRMERVLEKNSELLVKVQDELARRRQ
jgi:hypothetical protein